MLKTNRRSVANLRALARAASVCAVLFVWSSSARAQSQVSGASARSAPKINLRVPPAPKATDRSFRTHDGPSVRLGIGPGWFSATHEQGGSASQELTTSGWDANLDLHLGYAPTPGLTLGLVGMASFQMTGDWEMGGSTLAGGDLATVFVGPFVDGYLRPQGGWHFGGTAGLAQLRFDIDERSNATGFGGAIWAGRDFWVAPDWSLGSALRAGFLRGTDGASDTSASRFSLGVVFQATYQ